MKPLVYLLFGLLILIGCKKDSTADNIDSAIVVSMWETRDSVNRILQLHCKTVTIYPCSNFSILSDVDIYANKININFTEIFVPDACLTALGPATAIVDLGSLTSGTYDLNINVGKKNTKGKLIVTNDRFYMLLQNPQKLQLTNAELRRVPTNTIWGSISYQSSSSEEMAQSFIDSLISLGATFEAFAPGDYGYFQLDSNGQIIPTANSGSHFVNHFIFRYSGISANLQTLVSSFGSEVSILLLTAKDEEFWN